MNEMTLTHHQIARCRFILFLIHSGMSDELSHIWSGAFIEGIGEEEYTELFIEPYRQDEENE